MIFPFLNIDIVLFGNDDLPEKTISSKLMPSEISCYHPSYHGEATIVYVGNSSLYIPKTVEEFEKILTSYWEIVRKATQNNIVKPGKKFMN